MRESDGISYLTVLVVLIQAPLVVVPNFLDRQGFVERGGNACIGSVHCLFELCV